MEERITKAYKIVIIKRRNIETERTKNARNARKSIWERTIYIDRGEGEL